MSLQARRSKTAGDDRTVARSAVDAAVARATAALLSLRRDDGHWCFELEADATIPAEYVLLLHYLGEEDLALEAKIGAYLRRVQGGDGGWPLVHGGQSDISATVKAYFALKMIGDDIGAPHMVAARRVVLDHGGAGMSNALTRTQLALFGALPWRRVPAMPVEIMLLPRGFPFHLSKISYWARTVLVPALVLQALKPRARNARGIGIEELLPADTGAPPDAGHVNAALARLFRTVDGALHAVDPLFPRAARARAIAAARSFVDTRATAADGLGAIFPAMMNAVMMLDALGIARDDQRMVRARDALADLLVVRDGEAYCQPCLSPVWDTALAANAMLAVGTPEAAEGARGALEWLAPRQVTDVVGDWAWQRPGLAPGGWPFQYTNAHYPDLDDTAVVVLAMHKALAHGVPDGEGAVFRRAIARARDWVVGMQSRDGGWAAFDADNTHHYLNSIPFADHGALLDPPTADVTARCVLMLATLGDQPAPGSPLGRGLAWLLDAQERDGSWFGRWGINYVYGTWSVLEALVACGVDRDGAVIRRAVAWLERVQNEDGGWGEDAESYRLDRTRHGAAPSTPSQTAWAVMALLAAGENRSPAVERGVGFLLDRQQADGLWSEPQFTGTGFPRVFYLRYHGYPRIFPLWALARYGASSGH